MSVCLTVGVSCVAPSAGDSPSFSSPHRIGGRDEPESLSHTLRRNRHDGHARSEHVPTSQWINSSEAAAAGPGRARLSSFTPPAAPDYVVYRHVFHHLLALKEHAKEVERRGGNGRAIGDYYKDRARLKDDQAQAFEKIAADCERDVAKLDAKAQKIIDAAHARFPIGKVPAGAQLPPPPPELHRLQLERIQTIVEARNRLRSALGEQGFQQLDDLIKVNIAPQVQPQAIAPDQGKAAKHSAAK
jgi:hypothetical protein